jgi:hypothetical protein
LRWPSSNLPTLLTPSLGKEEGAREEKGRELEWEGGGGEGGQEEEEEEEEEGEEEEEEEVPDWRKQKGHWCQWCSLYARVRTRPRWRWLGYPPTCRQEWRRGRTRRRTRRNRKEAHAWNA